MTAAIIVGLLTAGGTYLVLQRGIVRVALGFVLLGHAGTTLLVAAGGVSRRAIPFFGEDGTQADPLPQAFALTAIVISFALTAFLFTLAYRARDVMGDDDIEAPDGPDPDTYDDAAVPDGSEADTLGDPDAPDPSDTDHDGSDAPNRSDALSPSDAARRSDEPSRSDAATDDTGEARS